ncbi:MAG: DedA family protein, partial [Chthoniobacterales bacterium]
WVSLVVGRPLIFRYGRWFFVSPQKLENAEDWLGRYENGGVFFARLLPVIRHLISIPAGVVRMPFGKFSAATIIGSGIWCTILAYLGDRAFRIEPKLLSDPESLVKFIKSQSVGIIGIIVAFTALYLLVVTLMKRGKRTS